MDGKKKLTVFTPTYNRAHLLKRVYDSLTKQNSNDFLWLIIDDGSKDNTKEIVDSFISEGKIEIIYKYFENGGKMRAHNRAAELADTELFLCLDSDDWLNEDAVDTLIRTWNEKGNNNLAGIISHKGASETKLLSGVEFPAGIDKSTLYGLYLKGFRGETTIMFRTDVIKNYPFPEIDGEKYVPEDYIYDKIDAKYEYVVLPCITTICELMEKGYTDSVSELKERNKEAFYLYYEQRARITPVSLLKIKYAGFYVKFAKKTGKDVFKTKLPKVYIIIGMLASKFIKGL